MRQVCSSCGSYRHLLKGCPDSWENMNKNVLVAEDTKNKEGDDFGIFFTMNEEEHSVLYTGNLKEENAILVAETKNKALLDTGCSATVAGQDWARILVGSLSEESRAKVEKLESVKTFRFGGGERRKSLGFWRIPCKLAGRNVMLETDVVEADIPCLLSKADLKRAGTVLKLKTDQAEIFGRTIDLESTSSGHYALKILDVGENEYEVLSARFGADFERKEKEIIDNPDIELNNTEPRDYTAILEADATAIVRRAKMEDVTMEWEVCNLGDKIFFRRGNDRKWRSPETVLNMTGKVTFVKNGRLYTTSSTRLLKANEVFEKCGEEIDKLGPVIEHHEIAKTANNLTKMKETESSDDEEGRRHEDEPERGMVDTPDVNPTQLNVDNEASALGVNRENNRTQNLRGEGHEAQWFDVEVMKKGGKSTTWKKDYFNVKFNNDSVGGIHLDKVPWRYQPTVQQQEVGQIDKVPEGESGEAQQEVAAFEGSPVYHEIVEEPDEEVYVVVIPGNLHNLNSKPVFDAKRKEGENLKTFKVYESVEDCGQQTTRTGWIITENMLGDVKGVKARIVARGKEDTQSVMEDSLTVGKVTQRIQFASAAQRDLFIRKVIELLREFFQFGNMGKEVFKYVKWSLNHEVGSILVDQKDYVKEEIMIIEIDKGKENDQGRESSRSGVNKGHWFTDQTRPECSYDDLELSTMINKDTVNDIPELNKMFLKQDSLGRIDELKLWVFSNESYDNLPDEESSRMGFIIFLSVGFNPGQVSPCFPLSWTACKVQRKVSSTCAAETLSLHAALEQEMIENKDTETVALIPIEYQLADCLTKWATSIRSLLQTIITGKFPSNINF